MKTEFFINIFGITYTEYICIYTVNWNHSIILSYTRKMLNFIQIFNKFCVNDKKEYISSQRFNASLLHTSK